MNGFQSLIYWKDYFNHPTGGRLGVLNAIQSIGSLASYPIAPYLNDGIGRRRTIWIGASIMVIGVALQVAAQNLSMFIASRFFIGFGTSFAAGAAPMLISEVSHPRYRSQLTALFNALYYSGNIIASWSAFGTSHIHSTWSWRIPSLMQAIIPSLQVLFVLFVPESPRWLMSKGQEKEALRILAYYHADGNEEDPLVQFEFQEIKAALDLDRTVKRNVGWMSLVSTAGNRKRLLLVIAISFFAQWSGNGLVSYYLNQVFDSIGITNPTIQLMINGILAVWNLVFSVAAAILVDRVGRRKLFITSCAGMLVFFTAQTICSAQFALHGNSNAAHAVIAFIFLFYAFYDIAFLPLIISYPIEILPYSIRAKGFTVAAFANSASLIFNQYINPIALEHIAWKYYIVYCCWIAFELVFCYFMIVETKGLTLEETAALFDGESYADQIARQAIEAADHNVEEVRVDDKDYDEKDSKA